MYTLLIALCLIALALVASSDDAAHFMTINAVYEGF
jgi:hypothetical protein